MDLPFTEKALNRPCPLCGNSRINVVGLVKDYSIMECSQCFLQFLDPIPDQKSLRAIYSDYYKAWNFFRSENEVSRMKKATFQGYLKRITPHISSGTLLDIGCATGELMSVGQEAGFDVYGVEISPYGIRRCKELFGENKVIGGQLKAGDFPPEFFDLITLSDVIEHIPEPHLFLDLVWSLLKYRGFLMLVTPDTSSWMRKLMGRRWFHYKEEHIYYYNRSNIVRLLSPRFETIISSNGYKTVTPDYCANIIKAYSDYNIFHKISYIARLVISGLRSRAFRVHIGEMFILCRKK